MSAVKNLKIAGRWKVHETENLDEWMKAVGVGTVARKIGINITVWEEWLQDGEYIIFKVICKLKTVQVKFKLNTPFTEHTIDGRKCQSEFYIDGSKLVLQQHSKCLSIITREVVNGKLVCTFEIDGETVSRRTFLRDD